jgi:hypothetical protein
MKEGLLCRGVERVVRGSREGCEINSIRTGHYPATSGRTSISIFAPSLAEAISSPVLRRQSVAGA